jgi:hypothetical protein
MLELPILVEENKRAIIAGVRYMIEALSRPAYVYLKVKIAPPCFGLFVFGVSNPRLNRAPEGMTVLPSSLFWRIRASSSSRWLESGLSVAWTLVKVSSDTLIPVIKNPGSLRPVHRKAKLAEIEPPHWHSFPQANQLLTLLALPEVLRKLLRLFARHDCREMSVILSGPLM